MTEDREVLEPEVLPPEGKERRRGKPPPGAWKRGQRAFGPIVAGLILDGMDLVTMGPAGFLLGAVTGYWIASVYDLPVAHRIILALIAGYYCMIPATRFMPLATVIGAYVRFRESGRNR